MDEKSLFTKFWTAETKTTRNVLARIPEGSDYRPDPKSRTAKEIAWQIVCEEKMIIEALENGKAEWAPPPLPATMKEVLDAYEAQSAGMTQRWNALPKERWEGKLAFFGSERPAAPMAWSFLFDIVHHRGQISTYLRPMGSTVPQIYGPSGDEPWLFLVVCCLLSVFPHEVRKRGKPNNRQPSTSNKASAANAARPGRVQSSADLIRGVRIDIECAARRAPGSGPRSRPGAKHR